MELQTINAIIKTLCYHEIFSYPLTFSELSTYLISRKKISDRELLFTLSKYQSLFFESQGFIVFRNSHKNIKKRIEKISENKKKLAKALWISQILSYIPTVQLIGISGSLAMYNAKKHDDIDLFFITSKKTLWLSRFLVNVTLFLFGQKRAVGKGFVRDKICPNMFITEDTLSIEKKIRTVYTAHEVAQLKILYSKNNMKERFFYENAWVLKYLPHAFKKNKSNNAPLRQNKILGALDYLFYIIQVLYMKKRRTIEVVQRQRAFFHPIKMGNIILQMYDLKVLCRKRLLLQTKPVTKPILSVN